MESGFESRIAWECYHFFNRIENYITFSVPIVIHISRNLIGTQGRSEFRPKQDQVVRSNVMSLC